VDSIQPSSGNAEQPVEMRETSPSTLEFLKAICHPIRLDILGALSRMATISPTEFARDRREPVGNVAYHFRELARLGFIELARTQPVRGATEHFYRRAKVVIFDDVSWLELPDEARQIVAQGTLRELVRLTNASIAAGTFTARADSHITWQSVRVDEEGWREITELLNSTFERIGAIQDDSTARLEACDGDPFVATVGLTGFESPPDHIGHS